MITNFKIFESNNLKYKINDYVYVVGFSNTDEFCKIIVVRTGPRLTKYEVGPYIWDYKIEAYDNRLGAFKNIYIDETNIKRKLTDQEIEEYEIKKSTLKYNL